MRTSGVLQCLVSVLLVLRPAAATKAPRWLDQSWFFAWDPPGTRLPVPTTAQCDTVHVTWSRQTATGRDPVAPYYLQIYTSNFIFPFIVPAGSNLETDLTIPFAPGTQYQICMFDSKGSTGGCQAVYTVYPNSTSSTPTCANLPMPAKTLNVVSEASQGNLSQFGWVPTCSDIKVTPKEGTPPFTFTVAPALHPPLNITSNDMSSINWTVSLTWGSSFFISLVDSTGLSWSNGPIHAGKGDSTCFSDSKSETSMAVTIGSAVGGAVVGALGSLLVAFLLSKRRNRDEDDETPRPFYTPHSPHLDHQQELQTAHHSPVAKRSTVTQYERLPSVVETLPDFHVEPFVPVQSRPLLSQAQSSDSDVSGQAARQSWNDGGDIRAHSVNVASPTEPGYHERGNSQVYVIHHDGGRAPVSVVTSHGTEVVELPPDYSPSFVPGSQAEGSQGGASTPRREVKSPAVTASSVQRSSR